MSYLQDKYQAGDILKIIHKYFPGPRVHIVPELIMSRHRKGYTYLKPLHPACDDDDDDDDVGRHEAKYVIIIIIIIIVVVIVVVVVVVVPIIIIMALFKMILRCSGPISRTVCWLVKCQGKIYTASCSIRWFYF